mmetsp:Transcript_13629/g.28903  ORF Transcript_13629/g.28903 Transcript_13629/m.28903 type:complete len:85 (+) Transcript_13629:150-404(+)
MVPCALCFFLGSPVPSVPRLGAYAEFQKSLRNALVAFSRSYMQSCGVVVVLCIRFGATTYQDFDALKLSCPCILTNDVAGCSFG